MYKLELNIEIPTLQRMDIGLYPLPNDEWVKGKRVLKLYNIWQWGSSSSK